MKITKEKFGSIGMVVSVLFSIIAIVISYLFIFIFNNDRSYVPTGNFDTYKSVDSSFEFNYDEELAIDDANSLIYDEDNSPLEAESIDSFEGTYAIFNTIPERLIGSDSCDEVAEEVETAFGLGEGVIDSVEEFTILTNRSCKFDYSNPTTGTDDSLIVVENQDDTETSQFFVLTSNDRDSEEFEMMLNTVYSLRYL